MTPNNISRVQAFRNKLCQTSEAKGAGVSTFPATTQQGLPRRVRVSINVNQEGWGHEMRRLLRLLVQHKTVGVADQRPVVCVKEHLVRELQKETTT